MGWINDGKGNFTWLPNGQTGIDARAQVRDIKELKTAKANTIIITQNNEAPQWYRLE
jgi:hypothetical protein